MQSGKVLPVPQPIVKLHVEDIMSDDEVLKKDGDLKSNPKDLDRLKELGKKKVNVRENLDGMITNKLRRKNRKESHMTLTKIPKTLPLFPYRLKKK